jgi:hypothetical protein
MKRVYLSLLVILSVSLITFMSCRKNQDGAKETVSAIVTPEGLAKDGAFMKLNDAINRFDPKYLQLVYKETKTTDQLIKEGNDLLIQLQTNPDNPGFQKQLADFYHFSSVVQLKEFSAAITENLKKLNEKYDFQKTLFVAGGGKPYAIARSLYAKNKIDNYPAGAKKTDGLWSDFVDTYFSEFGYYSDMYDESFQEAGEGGGGGCNESCCWERETCKSNARSKYYSNLWGYSLGGIASGGTVGAAGGSLVPGIGTAIGGFGLGIIGGIAGAISAGNIYQSDLTACATTYKACLEKKHGN